MRPIQQRQEYTTEVRVTFAGPESPYLTIHSGRKGKWKGLWDEDSVCDGAGDEWWMRGKNRGRGRRKVDREMREKKLEISERKRDKKRQGKKKREKEREGEKRKFSCTYNCQQQ